MKLKSYGRLTDSTRDARRVVCRIRTTGQNLPVATIRFPACNLATLNTAMVLMSTLLQAATSTRNVRTIHYRIIYWGIEALEDLKEDN